MGLECYLGIDGTVKDEVICEVEEGAKALGALRSVWKER